MSLNMTPLRLAVLSFLADKSSSFNAKRMVEALCPRVSPSGSMLSWTEQGLARQAGKVLKPLKDAGLIAEVDWRARMCSKQVFITEAGREQLAIHKAEASRLAISRAQQQHIANVYPECRAEMAAYLAAGVEVTIRQQREVPEVGPFAIEVRDTDFWIDCCETHEAALRQAQRLGLHVSS